MGVRVQRGVSAPPEVAFNTAIDPDRLRGWLPAPLRSGGSRPEIDIRALRARWPRERSAHWSAVIEVQPIDAGGALVQLELDGDLPDGRLTALADESLTHLAEHVADNLTAG